MCQCSITWRRVAVVLELRLCENEHNEKRNEVNSRINACILSFTSAHYVTHITRTCCISAMICSVVVAEVPLTSSYTPSILPIHSYCARYRARSCCATTSEPLMKGSYCLRNAWILERLCDINRQLKTEEIIKYEVRAEQRYCFTQPYNSQNQYIFRHRTTPSCVLRSVKDT
jgi:hypothetical protein